LPFERLYFVNRKLIAAKALKYCDCRGCQASMRLQVRPRPVHDAMVSAAEFGERVGVKEYRTLIHDAYSDSLSRSLRVKRPISRSDTPEKLATASPRISDGAGAMSTSSP
jgi:hypothetical protein